MPRCALLSVATEAQGRGTIELTNRAYIFKVEISRHLWITRLTPGHYGVPAFPYALDVQ